jgi:hypothetical protein
MTVGVVGAGSNVSGQVQGEGTEQRDANVTGDEDGLFGSPGARDAGAVSADAARVKECHPGGPRREKIFHLSAMAALGRA